MRKLSSKEWGTSEFPQRFEQPIKHTSLTMEESLESQFPRVHLHAQFTFARRINRQLLVIVKRFLKRGFWNPRVSWVILKRPTQNSARAVSKDQGLKFRGVVPHIETEKTLRQPVQERNVVC